MPEREADFFVKNNPPIEFFVILESLRRRDNISVGLLLGEKYFVKITEWILSFRILRSLNNQDIYVMNIQEKLTSGYKMVAEEVDVAKRGEAWTDTDSLILQTGFLRMDEWLRKTDFGRRIYVLTISKKLEENVREDITVRAFVKGMEAISAMEDEVFNFINSHWEDTEENIRANIKNGCEEEVYGDYCIGRSGTLMTVWCNTSVCELQCEVSMVKVECAEE